jgi:hypothetical protein
MEMRISDTATAIADKEVGEEVLSKIEAALRQNEKVILDFDGISVMTTFCGKQIFGRLYLKIGADEFFRRLTLKNVRDDLKIIIEQGILNALDSQKI